MRVVEKRFYLRNPRAVALDLLGKLLVRIYGGKRLSGFIVETEAYFGREDPASRARKGGSLAKIMEGDVGVALVYGIHRQWLLNVVAHEEGAAGAVLIRAIEPFEGIGTMMKLRGVSDLKNLTSGPGRLTKAMAIDKRFNKYPLYLSDGVLRIEYGIEVPREHICSSYRVGVSKDLPEKLRFYVRNSMFVSKKQL